MEKELKELILKLKSAGLQNEANKLIKVSEYMSANYFEDLKRDNYKNTKFVLTQIKSFLGLEIYDFMINDNEALNNFASGFSSFIKDNYHLKEWDFLKKFNPNNGNKPRVTYDSVTYSDKDLGKEGSFKFDSNHNPGKSGSGDLYRGYKTEGEEVATIPIGFTIYHIRKGDSSWSGPWLTLSHRTKNTEAVRDFLNNDSGAYDSDSEPISRLEFYKLMYERYKEDQEREEQREEGSGGSSGAATVTPPTSTTATTTYTPISIPNWIQDCTGDALIGTYCTDDDTSIIKKVQKLINYKSSGSQIKEDGYFGNETARALTQMGVDYENTIISIKSELESLAGTFPLNIPSSRRRRSGRGTNRGKPTGSTITITDQDIIGFF